MKNLQTFKLIVAGALLAMGMNADAAEPRPDAPAGSIPYQMTLKSLNAKQGMIAEDCAVYTEMVSCKPFPSSTIACGFPSGISIIVDRLTNENTVVCQPGYRFIGWAFDRSCLGNANPNLLEQSDYVVSGENYGHNFFYPKEFFGKCPTNPDLDNIGLWCGMGVVQGIVLGYNPSSDLEPTTPFDVFYAVFEQIPTEVSSSKLDLGVDFASGSRTIESPDEILPFTHSVNAWGEASAAERATISYRKDGAESQTMGEYADADVATWVPSGNGTYLFQHTPGSGLTATFTVDIPYTGSGTEEDPYVVTTQRGLRKVGELGGWVRLDRDIPSYDDRIYIAEGIGGLENLRPDNFTGGTLEPGQEIYLDLNGKKLSGFLASRGKLTLFDSAGGGDTSGLTIYGDGQIVDQYLSFTAVDGSVTVGMENALVSLEYAASKTGPWTAIDFAGGATLTIPSGTTYYFRSRSSTSPTPNSSYGIGTFTMTGAGKIDVGGQVASLVGVTCAKRSVSSYQYKSLFSGCQNLRTAPALPATTLAPSCYEGMFSGCTSLETAPALPATTLARLCYSRMFEDCSKLNSVKVNFTDWTDQRATEDWLPDNVGDFACPTELDLTSRTTSTVPPKWNIRHPAVTLVSVAQRYPWNNIVDYTYTLSNVWSSVNYKLAVEVTLNDVTKGVTNEVTTAIDGTYTGTFDLTPQFGNDAKDSESVFELKLIESMIRRPN